MKAIYKKRLLNVARALRESPAPKRFTMGQYGFDEPNTCGTPACALGHYAFRTDLQKTFNLYSSWVRFKKSSELVDHYSPEVSKHFDLTADETEELFGGEGCGNARTVEQAATYIEGFVKRKEAGR